MFLMDLVELKAVCNTRDFPVEDHVSNGPGGVESFKVFPYITVIFPFVSNGPGGVERLSQVPLLRLSFYTLVSNGPGGVESVNLNIL